MESAQPSSHQPHLQLVPQLPASRDTEFSWAIEKTSDGREITLIMVPRTPRVLQALRGFRGDLRLRKMTGESLSFEVLDAA